MSVTHSPDPPARKQRRKKLRKRRAPPPSEDEGDTEVEDAMLEVVDSTASVEASSSTVEGPLPLVAETIALVPDASPAPFVTPGCEDAWSLVAYPPSAEELQEASQYRAPPLPLRPPGVGIPHPGNPVVHWMWKEAVRRRCRVVR